MKTYIHKPVITNTQLHHISAVCVKKNDHFC